MKHASAKAFALTSTVTLILLTALTLRTGCVAAEPVVFGDPSKGEPVATIQDHGNKVKITSTGIAVEKGEPGDTSGTHVSISGDSEIDKAIAKLIKSRADAGHSWIEDAEDIVVPTVFFLFLLGVILGVKYLGNRSEQKRLELLRLMVEKGQPVPENVMNQILTPATAPENDTARKVYARTRNAYGFTIAGALLIGYAIMHSEWHNSSVLVPGLIFLCIGLGGMAGLYLPKREEKVTEQP